MLSMRESASFPIVIIFQTTLFSRRPSKKKNNSIELESFLILFFQTMHQHLLDNHNSELIVNQLEILPPHEKQKRQQAIIQTLYVSYNS
ncbi:transcription factor adf-1 [Vespula squamosa]|uniref:Transcription factor adf-1 n=1 Tax=Vespula squamosa TaxID=30214 RepID=A0ABD2B9X6_VESSQ